MATKTSQRIFIWVITIVMVVGTVMSFAVMIVASKNDKADQVAVDQATQKYKKEYEEYQKKVEAQAAVLSNKYYKQFAQYKDLPTRFDAAAVKKVVTKDLKIGSGKVLDKATAYSAYYIGWNPSGKVFDGSINGTALKAPIAGGNLISGWNEGVIGMKFGGVREITIPSEKAYGEQGSGDDIPPNTPIKFVVMVIESPEQIPQPEIPDILLQQYYQ